MPTNTRTAAEDKLWEALHANPGVTAGELAAAAQIGRSTAGKILTRWAHDGDATRIPGIMDGGRRAADRWTIASADTNHINAADVEEIADTDDAAAGLPAVMDGADSVDTSAANNTTTPTEDAPPITPVTGPAGDTVARLAPGELREMVVAFLNKHPREEFGPTAIGKALNRSSGAVNNALEKLVKTGHAVKTNEAPKRFSATKSDNPTTHATD